MGHLRQAVAAAATGMTIGAVAATPAVADVPVGAWSPTAAPILATVQGTASVLANGKVLLAGGAANTTDIHQQSELYDLVTDTWSQMATMQSPRVTATAVTLQSGKVLVVGGESMFASLNALATGELYDPATNTWAAVPGSMSSARANNPIAQLLPSGKVLIAGGSDTTGHPVATADLYDPGTNAFSAVNSMHTARQQAVAAVLPGGKVLVAGGIGGTGSTMLNSAEVYDPGNNTWTDVGNAMSDRRGYDPGVAELPGGRVLVMGGINQVGSPTTTTATADIYNPVTNAFSQAASMHISRTLFGVGTLPDGRVLVARGETQDAGHSPTTTPSAEVYDPAADAWRLIDPVPYGTAAGSTVVLPGGQVFVIDGGPDPNSSVTLNAAFLFTPTSAPGAPAAVSASAGTQSAFISFAPPASNGGLPVLNYTIAASTGQHVTTPDARTAVTMTGLTAGKPVTFTVRATTLFGTGLTSTASNQVVPVAPTPIKPPDRAPKLTIAKLKTKVKLAAFLKGVGFRVTPDKAAALQLSLVGSVGRATISRAFNLTLATKRLGSSGRARSVTLVPAKKLVGRPRSVTVQLVIVATDAAGSRSTTTRTIRVTR